MGAASDEPLFTPNEWLIVASLWVIYAVVLLSMDPEWVGWAAPLAFGGALVAADPPPIALFSASPREIFETASFMSLFSLLALGLLMVIRGEPGIGWLTRARQSFESGLLMLGTRVLKRLKSGGSSICERCYPPGAVVASRRETSERHSLRASRDCVATRPPERRIVQRDLRIGDQEVLQPLHEEAVSAGSNDLR